MVNRPCGQQPAMFAGPTGPQVTTRLRTRLLHVGVSVIFAELLCAILLALQVGIQRSFAIAFGGVVLYLAYPHCTAAGRRVPILVRAVAQRLMSRRTYQFRLVTLLAAMTVIAMVADLYVSPIREQFAEQARLDGKWMMIYEDGLPVTSAEGRPFFTVMTRDMYAVYPTEDPKRLEFRETAGNMLAIYRWESSDRIRVIRYWGRQQPTNESFESWDSWIAPGEFSNILYERVSD